MNNSKNIIIAIVVLVLLAVAFFTLSGGSEGDSGDTSTNALITLSASTDKEIYASGETVTLAIDLTNAGDDVTCISNNAQGNIAFLSVTRDGKSVDSRTTHADFLEALPILATADLAPVNAGDTFTIEAPSSFDPGLGSEALYVNVVDNIFADTTFYDIGVPGNYSVELAYEYVGNDSDTCASIYSDKTNTATINFTIE